MLIINIDICNRLCSYNLSDACNVICWWISKNEIPTYFQMNQFRCYLFYSSESLVQTVDTKIRYGYSTVLNIWKPPTYKIVFTFVNIKKMQKIDNDVSNTLSESLPITLLSKMFSVVNCHTGDQGSVPGWDCKDF